MSPATQTATAYSRFGLGVRADALEDSRDPLEALRADLNAGSPSLDAPLSPALKSYGYSRALPPTVELLAHIRTYNQDRREARKARSEPEPAMAGQMAPDAPETPEKKINLPQATLSAEALARFNGPYLNARVGFYERLVMFWANHFAVSVDKGLPVRMLAGAYEREAIRPNITGSFRDLLIAATRHPAMLSYLDNDRSIGPNSPANRSEKRGLNENLAREVLELHTLGVDGGYDQADVTALARILTGWGVARTPKALAGGDGFNFTPRAHEPGAHTVLGVSYAEDGEAQGVKALSDLSRHPATARHIAFKLARYFVADVPPPALTQRLSAVFLESDGDLSALYETLITSEESWAAPRTKLRLPQEYLIALLRATGRPAPAPKRLNASLKALGQPLWMPPGPNGFSDLSSAWATPEGLNSRLDVAYALAAPLAQKLDPRDFAETRLKGLLTDTTRQAVAQAETRAQGLALVFLSPEFMRR